jgi:ABC-type Fe3+/spermidine/putrescine transport system ATPase subunit
LGQNSFDTQLPFSYIHLTLKRVLINQLSISPLGVELRIGRTSQPGGEFVVKGDAVSISVRSGCMSVSRDKPNSVSLNTLQGTIEKILYLGDVFDYKVRVNDMLLRAQGDADERFEVKQEVYIYFNEEASGVCCFKTC